MFFFAFSARLLFFISLLVSDTLHLARCMAARMAFEGFGAFENGIQLIFRMCIPASDNVYK